MSFSCTDKYLTTDSRELAHILFENSLNSMLTGVNLVQSLVRLLQATEKPAKLIEIIRLLISAIIHKINDLQTHVYKSEMIESGSGSGMVAINKFFVISSLSSLVESLESMYRSYNSERVLSSEGMLFPARIVNY